MKSLLVCAFALALLLPGCTTWSREAQLGDTVVADVTAAGETQRLEFLLGDERMSLGHDLDTAMQNAKARDVLRSDGLLMVRNGVLGFDVPLGIYEDRNVTPAVGLVVDWPEGEFVVTATSATGAHIEAITVAPAFGAQVAPGLRLEEVAMPAGMRTAAVAPVGPFALAESLDTFALPSGHYLGLDAPEGWIRVVRLDEPPTACPAANQALYAPRVASGAIGSALTLDVLACGGIDKATLQWSTSVPTQFGPQVMELGTGPSYTLQASDARVFVPIRVTDGQAVVSFDAYTLGAGESDAVVPVEVEVVRVEAATGEGMDLQRTSVRTDYTPPAPPPTAPEPAGHVDDGHGH